MKRKFILITLLIMLALLSGSCANNNIPQPRPTTVRPSVAFQIDDLADYKIVGLNKISHGSGDLLKFEPEVPKAFPSGRYKIYFQKGRDKKIVLFESEINFGFYGRVVPGATVVDGYIQFVDPEKETLKTKLKEKIFGEEKGTVLTYAEDDYFIQMLYKKFQHPMTAEDAYNLNKVKDYALAIYFNGTDGIRDYHNKQSLVSALKQDY